ncbi:MAG: tetratricopeptide repeat protein [Burkholderiales bacterium]|nr:tetratricopeptide repeat protein [Burkholderiales bacterium]
MLHWLRRRIPDRTADTITAARSSLLEGRDAEAVALLDARLVRHPTDPEALHLRALAACRTGRFDVAVGWLERAIEADPAGLDPRVTLADVQLETGRGEAAIATLRAAIAIDPTRRDIQRRLLPVLGTYGRPDEAIEYWQLMRLLDWTCDPSRNPAAVLHAQGRLVDAEAKLEGLVRHAPRDANLHLLLGITRQARGHLDAATDCFRDAVRFGETIAAAHGKLAFALDSAGEVAASLLHYRQAAALDPTNAQAWSDYLAAKLYVAPAARAEAEADYEHFDRHFGMRVRDHKRHDVSPDPDRRLRIGYVSNDFQEHAIVHFFEPVLEHHERAEFEIWCYDRTFQRDATSHRLEQKADVWRAVGDLDAAGLADQIRTDQIDVLVDLKGHFDGNALPAFARKPAPVQFTWLGYPDTSGLSAMDGWITDTHIAADLTDQYTAETVIPLPHFFMAFRPADDPPDPGPLPALANRPVTFACFNTWSKVSAPMRDAMIAILRALPDARLLVTAMPGGETRARFVAQLEQAGVNPDRVTLRGRQSHRGFLEAHREVDLALDSFPYNGTTTSLNALWMGVPFVTRAGRTHVSRVGASVLTNVGLDDWITHSADDYVTAACRHAKDLDVLAQLRATLRQRMMGSALMDEPGFTRRLEAAYRDRWRQWCARAGA